MTQKSPLSLRRALVAVVCATVGGASVGHAQTDSAPARPQGAPAATVDSAAFERARQMVLGGNAVAGRALADSLVQAAPPSSPAYGDALYWRATIAATAADAERDYRRIIIEYPLAPHAGDALLALAQLEMSRGDRSAATAHLQRFLLEFPQRADRPRAGLWLGRLLLDQNDVPRACAALRDADAAVPAEQVELKNQIDYYLPRCVGVDTTTARPATPATGSPASSEAPLRTAPTTDTARRTPSREPAAPGETKAREAAPRATAPGGTAARTAPATRKREAASASGTWTVQIAAYQTQAEAEALVSKMKAREYDAYFTRSARIYRVRIGHFATRDEALALLSTLRQRGASGFVTAIDTSAR